eukprot:350203-Chlamydomonas_euryale.AAC.1
MPRRARMLCCMGRVVGRRLGYRNSDGCNAFNAHSACTTAHTRAACAPGSCCMPDWLCLHAQHGSPGACDPAIDRATVYASAGRRTQVVAWMDSAVSIAGVHNTALSWDGAEPNRYLHRSC